MGDPTRKDFVVRRFDVEELDAHANSGFDDSDYPQSFHGLLLIAEDGAQPSLERKRLAGTNETAAHGDIGGDACNSSAGLKVQELGIGGKGITDRVAPVAHSEGAGRTLGGMVVHGNYVAHDYGDPREVRKSKAEWSFPHYPKYRPNRPAEKHPQRTGTAKEITTRRVTGMDSE